MIYCIVNRREIGHLVFTLLPTECVMMIPPDAKFIALLHANAHPYTTACSFQLGFVSPLSLNIKVNEK
jgi:hypothetical protein